ncbi:MAG: hypothetical protein LC109_09445, partial [Bacteroidia bacterium]|nr:hypothetical protein [Bacteroidia bacterium]
IIPIIIMYVKSQQKKGRAINSLKALALKENKHISESDTWKENAIGLDENKTTVFAIRKTKDSIIPYTIRLKDVKSCQFINRSSTNFIEQLTLTFTFKDNAKSNLTLDFYHNELDSTEIADELQLIQKWDKLINERMKEIA